MGLLGTWPPYLLDVGSINRGKDKILISQGERQDKGYSIEVRRRVKGSNLIFPETCLRLSSNSLSSRE